MRKPIPFESIFNASGRAVSHESEIVAIAKGAAWDEGYRYNGTMISSGSDHYWYLFLDGECHLIVGGRSAGVSVNGTRARRYVLYRLGATQPPLEPSESRIPTQLELESEVFAQRREVQCASELIEAAGNGSLERVKELLEDGANVNGLTQHNYPPIAAAAEYGHLDVVRYLLQAGADVSWVSPDGWNIVLLAAARANVTLLKTLEKAGARFDARTTDGRTPLHEAAESGNRGVVSFLLRRGESPNVALRDGASPLHVASRKGHLAVVKTLLEYGAEARAKNKHGDDALDLAVSSGHASVARALLGARPNLKRGRPEGLVRRAVASGSHQTLAVVLSAARSVDWTRIHGTPPLQNASSHGSVPMIRKLLAAGAEPCRGDLWSAAASGSAVAVKLLLDSRLSLSQTPSDLGSLLVHAIRNGSYDVVRLLIQRGADVNAQTENGHTPLSMAVLGPHEFYNQNPPLDLELIKLLIRQGARHDMPDANGRSILMRASANDSAGTVQLLLKTGARVDERDDEGNTALIIAAQSGRLKVVRTLLRFHADPNLKNNKGMKALALARRRGHTAVAELLSPLSRRSGIKRET